ncbi:MAG: hypothetical protein LBE04_07075, partial [Prevotellaceae bacterium]|nr:hypothetical protein [Prevotellaceae bacterium]
SPPPPPSFPLGLTEGVGVVPELCYACSGLCIFDVFVSAICYSIMRHSNLRYVKFFTYLYFSIIL